MRVLLAACVLAIFSGCLFSRSPIERGLRETNDRFEVIKLNQGALSPDQRKVVEESGPPKFIVFETQLKTGAPVQRWVYPQDKLQYVFLAGKKVDYVVVESSGKNPLLEAAQGDQGPLLIAWQWIQLGMHWLKDQ